MDSQQDRQVEAIAADAVVAATTMHHRDQFLRTLPPGDYRLSFDEDKPVFGLVGMDGQAEKTQQEALTPAGDSRLLDVLRARDLKPIHPMRRPTAPPLNEQRITRVNGVSPRFLVHNDGEANIEDRCLWPDFGPIIDNHGLTGAFVILHYQARPKSQRRWGIYDSVSNNYHSCPSHKLGIAAIPTPVDVERLGYTVVPTSVLVFLGASLVVHKGRHMICMLPAETQPENVGAIDGDSR